MPDGLPTVPDYPCLVRLAPLVNDGAVSPAVTPFIGGVTHPAGYLVAGDASGSLRMIKALQAPATPPTFSDAQLGKVIQLPTSPPLARHAAGPQRPTRINGPAAPQNGA